MTSFSKKNVLPDFEVIAEIFRNTREEKNVSLEEVSQVLGIDIKYLKALEQGRIDRLPKGVYEKNFLREYSSYLGIDPKEILEVYDKNVRHEVENRQKSMFVRKVSGEQYFLLVPRIIKNTLIFCVVLACIVYIGFYLKNIVAAPELVVFEPENNMNIIEHEIEIYGKTEKEVEVEINNKKVLINDEGIFREIINLKTGINNIEVKAKKRYSETNIIKRTILVK